VTTPTTVQVQIQLRGDTASNWTAANPVLLNNELGLETDTKKLKVGNGSTAWNSLAYFPSIVTGGTVLGNLEIGTTGTLTFEGSSADNFETTLGVINPTADRTINLPNQSGTVVVSGNATIVDADIAANAEIAVSKLADGAARQLLQTDAAGTGVEWTSNVDVPGTLDVTGAATFDAAVTIAGDLTVNGTTTNINTQNLVVEDKNIILADVASPTDVTADGGGITLKGATDKTITWSDTTDAWTSNQVLDVPAGSAATPSLIFGADVNTGIYSPGADQVAISTNGTGRLFVDASGNVGINVASPGSFEPGARNLVVGSGSGDNGLSIYSATTGQGIIYFADGTTGAQKYTGFIAYDHSTNALRFGANDGNERMRLDSSGRLGLGTSSPTTTFDCRGVISTNDALYCYNSARDGLGIWYNPGGAGVNQLTARVNGGDRLTIDSSGNVGIGTTSPGSYSSAANQLVVGSASGNQGITIAAGSSSYSAVYFADGTAGTEPYRGIVGYNHASDGLEFYTAGLLRSTIDSSGRLLVGTSSGSFSTTVKLQGNSGASTGESRIRFCRGQATPADGAALGIIGFSDNTETPSAEIVAQRDGGTWSASSVPGRLVFSVTSDNSASPTEAMRIGSDQSIRTYASGTALALSTAAAAGTTSALIWGRYSATAVNTGTTSFYVWSNGNVQNTNNSYGAISDIKLKENIIDAGSQWDDLKALQVRKYNFKEGQTHTQIGLIAQEVELVSPGLVSESPDRDADGNDLGTVTKSVNYSVLYIKAVKALQEAMERIETLEAKVAALEAA
jgi:hypothetical protein